MIQPSPEDTKTFNELLPVIERQIDNRRRKWRWTTMDWLDVRQILLIRVWTKIGLYDSRKGPFEHWVNRLISNALVIVQRDNMLKFARPCIRNGGCFFNLGGTHCGYTTNGLQCNACPLYAKWEQTKQSEHNIKTSLAMEHHSQEVNNIQSDFIDIEAKKVLIDKRMMQLLKTPWERKVYKVLYIDHLTPAQAADLLKESARNRKTPLRATDAVDYQSVLLEVKRLKEMMVKIIREELDVV